MPRRRYLFDPPERFVAGTVGQPGDRTFFLQARDGPRVVSVVLEKVQVAVLADRLGELLSELERRGETQAALADATHMDDHAPLDEPINEAFRAGSLTLGWDGGAGRVLVEARAQSEDGEIIDPDEDDDEDEDGPDLLRVRMTAWTPRGRSWPAPGAWSPRAGRPAPCAASRSTRRATSARARTGISSTRRPKPHPVLDSATTLEVLREGDIEIVGRIVGSSNNAMLATVTWACPEPEPAVILDAIYKPTLGERPLDDFPDGTLARREVAAWHVSEASGWGIVPPTVLRDGPFGEGMVQSYVDADPDVDVVELVVVEDDPRLRRMAVLDAVMNNTDRKGGHILPVDGARHIHGVDHGVCFSSVPKLRTVLWGWRGEPFAPDEIEGLARIQIALGGDLGPKLRELLSRTEVTPRRIAETSPFVSVLSRSRHPAGRRCPGHRSERAGPVTVARSERTRRPGGGPSPRRTIRAEVAMRRWNGWGDDSVEAGAPERGMTLLRELIGPSRRPVDASLEAVVGAVPASRLTAGDGFDIDPLARVLHARGQSLPDWIALRSGRLGAVPDAIVRPPDSPSVAALLASAADNSWTLVPYGGGSSVVGGVTILPSDRPVVTVDMAGTAGMLRLDESSGLATFGAGTFGPALEAALEPHGLTLGHYPQSFEGSSVGGWVVTRSVGQQARGYGRIDELFAGGRLETPRGRWTCRPIRRRRPGRTCARSSSGRRAGSAS